MEASKESMGKRIARLRKQKHMTQERLASRLGVTAQAVSKWENDLSCPDISILPLLAKELDISVDILLGGEGGSTQETGSGKCMEPYTEEDEEREGVLNLRINLKKKWYLIVIGVLMVGAGILFLLNQFNVISLNTASFWSVVWPLLVLFLGISMMDESFNYIGCGVALFGLYKLLYNLGLLPESWLLTWDMVWPFALILLGISVFVGVFKKKKKSHITFSKNGKKYYSENKVDKCMYNGESMIVELAFCSGIYVPDRRVGKVMVESSFGNCTLDLRNCDCGETLILDADVNFGDLTVIVPPWMQARTDTSSKFGKTEIPPYMFGEEANTILQLGGSVNFGSIKVVYDD